MYGPFAVVDATNANAGAADTQSLGNSSFGRMVIAAAEADRLASEAEKLAKETAAIAKLRNEELDDYIRRHAQRSTEAHTKERPKFPSDPPDTINVSATCISETGIAEKTIISEAYISCIKTNKTQADDRSISSISTMDDSRLQELCNASKIGSGPNYENISGLGISSNQHVGGNADSLQLPFPITLHTLLKDNPCPSAISWNRKGTKVKMHTKHKEFEHIIKNYFGNDSNFTNLRRKANRWRFRSQCIDKDTSLFILQNIHFVKDTEPKCSEICAKMAKSEAQI